MRGSGPPVIQAMRSRCLCQSQRLGRHLLRWLLDGQHTGRYRWDQLHNTEKTHAGTLVEIALACSLRLADGATLD
jgi:hypothetical protein